MLPALRARARAAEKELVEQLTAPDASAAQEPSVVESMQAEVIDNLQQQLGACAHCSLVSRSVPCLVSFFKPVLCCVFLSHDLRLSYRALIILLLLLCHVRYSRV